MSDISGPGEPSPTVAEEVNEVRELFPSNATLEDAIRLLNGHGFDRAEISIPVASPAGAEATPEQGAANPTTDVDDQQSRTLHASLAASVGALAAAGAVIATGGAAAPAIAAAVAGGVGLGAATEGVTNAFSHVENEAREEAAKRGELILSVMIRRPDQQAKAEAAMWKAGAMRVTPVTRTASTDTEPR